MGLFGGGDETTRIVVEVDGEGAVRAYKQIGEAQEQVIKDADKASSSFADVSSAIAGYAATASGAITAISGLAVGTITLAGNLAQSGAQIDDIQTSFDNLSTKAGVLSQTLINDLSNAFGGTVSNVELMTSANKALLSELDPAAFDEIAQAARAYADTVGTDAKDEFDAFLQGLARGDDRFLKQRGILLDNEKAFEEYAKKIGTTADQLSELGKAEALREAGTKALIEQTQKLGKVENDVGDAFETVKVAVINVRDEFLKAVGTNQTLGQTFTDLAKSINETDFSQLIQDLTTLITISAQAASSILQVGKAIDEGLSGVAGAIRQQFKGTGDVIAEEIINNGLEDVVNYLSQDTPEATKKAIKAFAELEKAASAQGRAVQADLVGSFEQVGQQLKAQAENFGILKKEIEKTTPKVEGLEKPLKLLTKTGTEGADKAKKLSEEIAKLSSITAEAAGLDRFPALKEEIEKAFSEEGVQSAKELSEALNKIGAAALKAEIPLEDVSKIIEEIRSKPILGPGNAQGLEEFTKQSQALKDAAKSAAEQFNAELAGTISQGLTNAISAAISGDKTGIKDSLRGLGADLGQQAGAALGESLAGPIGAEIGGPIGEALGDALGKAVFDTFDHIFGGGQDAENNARKKVDQFLAEVFETERLKVLINGKLTDVFDLNFGGGNGFNDGTFDDLFQGLTESSQQAFSGVGNALNSLLESGQSIGSQIAAVLTNNIGGSLNNLQILVGTLGFSFEQLKEAIVNSALKGEISFLEAQSSLIGIQKIAEKGIPDAFGDVTQAFQNLLDAGTKGGRVTVDALQDIAAEAEELGISTIPELQAQLVNSGQFTQEQIEGLFAALAQSGIDSLDELLNASSETLIAILSDLQSEDVLQEAQTQALDLIDTINNIPSEKDVVINVRSNVDNQTRQVLSALEIPQVQNSEAP